MLTFFLLAMARPVSFCSEELIEEIRRVSREEARAELNRGAISAGRLQSITNSASRHLRAALSGQQTPSSGAEENSSTADSVRSTPQATPTAASVWGDYGPLYRQRFRGPRKGPKSKKGKFGSPCLQTRVYQVKLLAMDCEGQSKYLLEEHDTVMDVMLTVIETGNKDAYRWHRLQY